MHGPVVVSWLLASLCAATGGYCLALGARGPVPVRPTARLEAVMGLGMATMALPAGAAVLPGGLYVLLFGAVAGWSAWSGWCARSARRRARAPDTHRSHARHGPHHTIEALAMVYMALVMTVAEGGGPHPGHHGPAAGVPLLTGGLLLYFAVFALYTGARLIPATAHPPAGHGTYGVRVPVPPDACRLALALGSLTMLMTL